MISDILKFFLGEVVKNEMIFEAGFDGFLVVYFFRVILKFDFFGDAILYFFEPSVGLNENGGTKFLKTSDFRRTSVLRSTSGSI